MAGRQTVVGALVSGALFLGVALVAGLIVSAYTDSWAWTVVVGVVAGAAAEWVYAAAVAWKRGRGGREDSGVGPDARR